jgi:hypothetical protein
MDITIVIVNWNTEDLLAQCLYSLEENVLAAEDLNTETIIVDNSSTDGSSTMVRKRFPWVYLIENSENVGFARANNQVLRDACGRYVVLLNSDTLVHPDAFETMVEFMDTFPRAGGGGPRLLNEDGTLQPSCHPMLTPGREFWRLMFLDEIWHRATYKQADWDIGKSRRVEVIKGACLMLRREALDEVGLLDERYFMYTEEMDLCYRLLQAGWELWWVPQAVVTHYGEASSRLVAEEMYIQLYRSKVQFHRKFGGNQRADRFKRLVALAYIPRWAIIRLVARFRPARVDRAHTYRRLLAELPTM